MTLLISQGAEAKIYLTKSASKITKDRIPKTYRHPQLDTRIRKRRTKAEAKILQKAAQAKINVPIITHTDNLNSILYMQYIKGDRLSQTLNSYPEKKQISTMKKIATQVAKLHTNNIIHSDLTTSNIILQEKTSKIFLIDFGLSYISTKIEDKAVDLHLLKQALQAKHFLSHKDLFKAFKKAYIHKDAEKIFERLTIVEKRGRYKH
jgi:Kae1-associated kinase Bud32